MYSSFEIHTSEKFPSNNGKVNFEGLVHLLKYIRDSKNPGLKYYAIIEDSPISELYRQARIKNENQLMVYSDYIWKYCTDTGIRTGSYVAFSQGGKIDHCPHVPGPVA